jgi:hypothetical protein
MIFKEFDEMEFTDENVRPESPVLPFISISTSSTIPPTDYSKSFHDVHLIKKPSFFKELAKKK